MKTIPETLAIAVQNHQAGRLDAAEAVYRQVIALDPNDADAWNLLGVLHTQLGRSQDGIDCLHRALALRPDWAEALYNLGWTLREQGRSEDAAANLRRAIELRPNCAEAHDALGVVLQEQGKPDEAVARHRRALELAPDSAAVYNNLGLALAAQRNLDQAAACYAKALQLRPLFAAAHENLGSLRADQGRFAEAAASLRRALELDPRAAGIHCHLGNVFWRSGELDEAFDCYRRALDLKSDYAEADSALLCALQYRASATLRELANAHAGYQREHCARLRSAWRAHDNLRDPWRRLRVGFLSRDLHRHPVGYFLVRALENLDRGQCETVCYSDRTARDDLTTRLQAAAATWRDVIGTSDEQLAEQIRADRIDILFDLAGHTAHNRLLVFARKPAPIQITWAGYAGTTGLAAMDYILADPYEIPPQLEEYFHERVLRMPDGYVCYDPPEYAPPVSPLPALENEYVKLAAFHNPPKITPRVVEVWAKVLTRLPQARLVLKFLGMDDASVAGRLADLFAAQGIDRARLEFLGSSPHGAMLAQYQRVDLALDTFPYNGGLTTCEALWMGVPVVTSPGETFAGRHSLSHLSNVGLTETIAGDLDEYVELAVALAGDLPRLAALRGGLRERMATSPLCDGKRFAENFAEILRGVWRDLCENNGPDN